MNLFEATGRITKRAIVRGPYKPSDLVYAAYNRCQCGAGLAYVPGDDSKSWDCGDILTGVAIPFGEEGAVMHCSPYPFVFYEIKSEHQPSARGATTRPQKVK